MILGTYNSTNLVLLWVPEHSVKLANNLHLTEFILTDTWAEESEVPASFTKGAFGNFYFSEVGEKCLK